MYDRVRDDPNAPWNRQEIECEECEAVCFATGECPECHNQNEKAEQ